MKKTLVWVLGLALAALPVTGCRTANRGSWIGTGVGAASGALIGGIIGHQSGHKWQGAAIGAGVGALAGYIVGTELGAQGDLRHQNSPEHKKAQQIFHRANRTENPREAIELYKQAVAIDPLHPEPYNNMGLVYLKLGDREMAKINFKQALAVDPSFRPAQDNLARLQGGQ